MHPLGFWLTAVKRLLVFSGKLQQGLHWPFKEGGNGQHRYRLSDKTEISASHSPTHRWEKDYFLTAGYKCFTYFSQGFLRSHALIQQLYFLLSFFCLGGLCAFVFLIFQYGLVSSYNGQCVLKFRLPYKVLIILSLLLLIKILFSAKGHLQFRISSLACTPNIKCHIKKL